MAIKSLLSLLALHGKVIITTNDGIPIATISRGKDLYDWVITEWGREVPGEVDEEAKDSGYRL